VERDAWTYFPGFLRFPILQFKGIIFAGAISAFVPYVILVMLYSWRVGDISNFADLGKYGTASFLVFCAAWSLIPVTFAVALCIVCDTLVNDRTGAGMYRVALISAAIVLFVAFVVHQTYISVDPRYRQIFWSGLISTAFFAFPSLVIFGVSLREYAKDESRTPGPNDGVLQMHGRAEI
jgi:hypothetical protein